MNNNEKFQIHIKENPRVLVFFYTSWCIPCQNVEPFYLEQSSVFQSVSLLKVNVDLAEEISVYFDIFAMPTFIYLQTGKEKERFQGSNREKLAAFLGTLNLV